MTLSQKQAREASNIVFYVPERKVHPSLTSHPRYLTRDGKESATRRALFTNQHNIHLFIDHSNNKLKMTRAGKGNCFWCGEGGHFHANCCASNDHPGVIFNAKFYSFKAQEEEQVRKPGGLKSTEKTSSNKEHGINHIDTAFLFNETTSEMKMFSVANHHMALLDTGSSVSALRRADFVIRFESCGQRVISVWQ